MKAGVHPTSSDHAIPERRVRAWAAGVGALAAFEDAAFRRLWAANLLSQLGTMISRVALIMFFGQSVHSVAAVGTLILFESLPGAVAALVSGAIVDRASKRRLLIGMDLIRAGLIACAIVWPYAWVIYAITGAASVCAAFFNPARTASLPLAVDPAALTNANAMDQATSTLVFALGPALAAALYLGAGLSITLAVDAISFLLSAALLVPLRLRVVHAEAERPRESTLAQVRDGWRYLADHAIVLHLVGATAVSLLCVGLWIPVAPAFLRTVFAASERALGYQFALFGVGGLLGSLAAPAIVRRWGPGPVFSGMLVGEAAAMLAYSLTTVLLWSNAIILAWGAIVSLMLVPYYSLIQTRVADEFLGRVFAVARQGEHLATVLAIGAAVALQTRLAPREIVLIAACLYLVLAAASLRLRSGRELLRTV